MNDVSEMISGHVFDMLDPQQVRELCDWIKADRENARRFARETLILAHVRQQIIGESNLRLEAESQALSAEEDPIDDRFDSTLILQAVEQDLRASQTRRQATDQTSPSVPVRLSPVHVSDSASEPQRRYIVIPRSVVYLAVAAMAAVFILAVQPWFRSNQQMFLPPSHDPAGFEVARLTEAVNCVWDDPQVPTQSGAELRPGKLNLVQGRARITFRSGAQVVLAAPCTFEIKNDMRGYLHGGQLSANVPRRARGFTVETRSVQIVDLGTEFGVRIEPTTGEVEVHVFAGEVEAHMLDRRGVPHRTKRLMSDEAARFDSRNEQITAITVDERPFHRTTLANTPYAAQVLADRPLGYWPLTEQAGQMIIEDHSGNHFHGRVHGQVDVAGTTGIEPNNYAAVFRGEGQIDIGVFPQFRMANNFTIEAWVRLDDLEGRGGWFVSAYVGRGINHGWGLGYNVPNRFDHRRFHPGIRAGIFDVRDYDFASATSLLKPGTWHHCVLTVDELSVGRFYLDGKHVQTITGAEPAILDNYFIVLGGIHNAPSHFNGALAHVAIYNRVLGEDRIESHYLAANPTETRPADGN